MSRAEGQLDRAVGRYYQGELGERYFAYQQAGADLAAISVAPWFQAHIRATDRVVDFGCGAGGLLAVLDAAAKTGIEPNAAPRRAAAHRGLTVVAAPADLPDATAEVVITNHALEHTLAPLAELQALRRLIAPGGRLVLNLPLDDWRTQRRVHSESDHHLYTWTPQLLANLLDEAGFEIRECRVVAYALPYYNEWLHARVSQRTFDAVCRLWARLRRQRQLFAVALPRQV